MTESIERTQIPEPPVRPHDAHKGTFGRALVIAGSEGMSGAAVLAGRAALHGGAGLVTVAAPHVIAPVIASATPAYMTISLSCEAGKVTLDAMQILRQTWNCQNAVAIGPGLGRSNSVEEVCRSVYTECPRALVVDADGLNALAQQPNQLPTRIHGADRILTPHPAEFSRLTQLPVDLIQSNRRTFAIQFALQHRVVLLLKGPQTIITDGTKYATNQTGCNSLATGGSGDILTGLILSFLAQGMPAFESAQLAAHLHGRMGECASQKFNPRFVTSGELLPCINDAWNRLDADRAP